MYGAVAVLMSVLLVSLLACGAWLDVRTRRIPNRLTVAGFAAGLCVRAASAWIAGDAAPLLSGLAGAAISFAALFPLFMAGALGGGDVKLATAAGAILGYEHVVLALLASAIAGGVLALVTAVRRGVLLPVLVGTRDLVMYCVSLGRAGSRYTLAAPGAVTIPYGVAIAIGSIVGWLL